MVKPIYSITPFTLLDYPKHTACILWFAGCNMRCDYCYNPDIVLGKGRKSIAEVEQFLLSRKGLLQAVVLSGGECTIHPSFIKIVNIAKRLGFLVKVDTNGSKPEVLSRLIANNQIDYVALDFKALRKNYYNVTKLNGFDTFQETLQLLQGASIPFEVRTTWHSGLFDYDFLKEMVRYLEDAAYRGDYYIQRFFNNVPTLGNLPNMYDHLDTETLSTDSISVHVRNG